MSKIVTLSPTAITVSGMQIRLQMDRAHIDDLVELFDEQDPTWPDGLPPVVVYCDGKSYYMADGHHRLEAAALAGCTEIRAEAHKGTKEDALQHACGANARHGLKRTYADKRNAVKIAYQLSPCSSNRVIAKMCKVSHFLVADVLRELKGLKPTAAKKLETREVECGRSSTLDTPGRKLSEMGFDVTPGGGGLSNDEPEDGRNIAGEGVPAAPKASQPVPLEDQFARADELIRELALLLDEMGRAPGGELLRSHYLKLKAETRNGEKVERLYSLDLENLRFELRHWKPYLPLCPICNGVPSQSCNVCLGLPYITRGAYDGLTKSQKEKLEQVPHDAA